MNKNNVEVKIVEVKVYIPLAVGDDDDVTPAKCVKWVEDSLNATCPGIYDKCELGEVIE